MLHGGERGRFVNRHCASFRIGTIGTPYHGRANLARVCYIRKRDDFRICSDLGGWQHWRFTASCGGEQFHLMQIIRDFSGAACVSSEREHILTDRVTGWGRGISVSVGTSFRFTSWILSDRSAVTHKRRKEIGTLCRLSHYV